MEVGSEEVEDPPVGEMTRRLNAIQEKEIERTETCVIQNESSPDFHGNSPNDILEEMFD